MATDGESAKTPTIMGGIMAEVRSYLARQKADEAAQPAAVRPAKRDLAEERAEASQAGKLQRMDRHAATMIDPTIGDWRHAPELVAASQRLTDLREGQADLAAVIAAAEVDLVRANERLLEAEGLHHLGRLSAKDLAAAQAAAVVARKRSAVATATKAEAEREIAAVTPLIEPLRELLMTEAAGKHLVRYKAAVQRLDAAMDEVVAANAEVDAVYQRLSWGFGKLERPKTSLGAVSNLAMSQLSPDYVASWRKLAAGAGLLKGGK